MTYIVHISLFDFGPIFPPTLTPTYRGSLFNIPPGPAFDTATSVPPASTLTFPLTPAVPVVPMALLVTDATGGGDLFRSGLRVLPPSPATVSLVTAIGGVSSTAIPAMTAGLVGMSFPVEIPEGARVVIGIFAFGFVPPNSLTITGLTLVTGAGTITLTITGSASYRWLILIPVTSSFTYTSTLSLSPSGDARTPAQILRATPSASTLSFTDPFLRSLSQFVGLVDAEVGKRIEGILNQAVAKAVDATLASRGSVRTTTSVISLHRITITAGGIGLHIGIADFRNPVMAAPPNTSLKISITPVPLRGRLQTYTVHVTNAAGAPVVGAAVTLTNYQSIGNANPTTSNCPPTNAQGTTHFSVALRGYHHDASGHGGGVVDRYPSLTASAAGYQNATIELVMGSIE